MEVEQTKSWFLQICNIIVHKTLAASLESPMAACYSKSELAYVIACMCFDM